MTKHPAMTKHAVAIAGGGPAGLMLAGELPTRRNYGLALRQDRVERILAAWVDELAVPICRGREVTGFAHDDTGVDVELGGVIAEVEMTGEPERGVRRDDNNK
jgi:2-polyprenyl-6-methoxyphenol hydroxylase-like FAD-dependent oxidoreductase